MQRRKIKVLRIINRFNIGGPTYNATFLSKFLSDDFETLLIGGLPEEGEYDSLHIPHSYGIVPLLIPELKRQPNFFSDRKALKKIKEIIREFKPDIVHTHASKAGAIGRKAAIDCKVPVIVHTFHGHVFHSYFGSFKTHIFKFIERRLAAKTNGIIAISALQKKELCDQYRIAPENKTTVIPLGFDLQKFQLHQQAKRAKTRQEFGIHDDEVAIAIIGRLSPVKNHSFFIDVIANLHVRTTKKIKVFIVGDGEERDSIQQKIEVLCLTAPILFTSWINDISSFNPGMDIICLTSHNEGTPVSLIEAQACNVAFLSTDVGGVRDIVDDGNTGYICPPNNLENYTDKLLELVEDENIRQKMSQNGWSFVENKFGYQRLVKDVEIYYKNKLGEKGYIFE
ncbi:MAG: glycosyltransferase [Crocinitomicaceae bacterium]